LASTTPDTFKITLDAGLTNAFVPTTIADKDFLRCSLFK